MGKLNLDDDLAALLNADALAHGKTVDQRAADILRCALETPQARTKRLFDAMARVAALTPARVLQTDSTSLIREDRDR